MGSVGKRDAYMYRDEPPAFLYILFSSSQLEHSNTTRAYGFRSSSTLLLHCERHSSSLLSPQELRFSETAIMVNVAAFFEPHLKLRLHIAETVLIIIALILTGIYISMISFITRSDIMIIPFVSFHPPLYCIDSNNMLTRSSLLLLQSVKSLIIIGYQLLSQHTTRYRKWESLKANMILNFIEPVFWFVVIILKGMGMSRSCTGGSCGVSVAVMLVALVIL